MKNRNKKKYIYIYIFRMFLVILFQNLLFIDCLKVPGHIQNIKFFSPNTSQFFDNL